MPHRGEARDPLAKGGDKTRILDEVRGEVEQLDRLSGLGINATAAPAESIVDRRNRGV